MNGRLFLHVYCQYHWYDICAEIIDAIVRSAFPLPLEAHLVGTESDEAELRELLGAVDLFADIIRHVENQYEYPTIHALWTWGRNRPSDYAVYIHTKGVTSARPTYTKWRWCMLQTVIVDWRDRLKEIADYDIIGAFYSSEGPWIAGNFWWAKNQWIAHLPEPKPSADRFIYERFLFQTSMHPKMRILLDENVLRPHLSTTYTRLGNPQGHFFRWRLHNATKMDTKRIYL